MRMGSLADAGGTAGVGLFADGTIMDVFDLRPDFGLTSAIYDGFFLGAKDSTARPPQVAFSCVTGNCTWPVFTSAAICSTCNDVSSTVVRKRREGCKSQDATNQELGVNVVEIGPCTEYIAPYANIKQFDGLAEAPDDLGDSVQPATSTFVGLTANTTMDYRSTISLQDHDTLFHSFLMLRAPQNFIAKQISWEDASIEATECGLYLCAAATKAQVNSGVLTEERLGVWSNRVQGSWDSLATDNKSRNLVANVYPSLKPVAKFRSDIQISIPAGETERLGANGSTVFNFTQASIIGLQKTLDLLTLGDNPTNKSLLVYPTNSRNSEISALSHILGQSDNLTHTFEMLAERLTVHIRDGGRMIQEGTTDEFILLIHVDWPFLIAPILAVLAGCLYFAVIMFQTWRLGLPVWKESAYPTLTYGFDEKTQSLFRVADGHGSEAGTAKLLRKRTQIGFMDGQDGLRLNLATPPGRA